MSIVSRDFRRALFRAAAQLVSGFAAFSILAELVVAATLPAYSSLSPNVYYSCQPQGSARRQLLDTAITTSTITYIVSDGTAGVVGCNRDGTIFFPTPALPPGTYTLQTRSKGGQVLPGYRDETVTVGVAPPSTAVFSLFHPPSNTFFATASQIDRDQLVLLGWQLADSGFRVWPANGPAPEVSRPVCRFYYAARTTHFYTASEVDCASLKSTPGFTYEGIAFRALVPFGGRCGPETKAVYRLFDPVRVNHRYTINADTVASTLVSFAMQTNEQVSLPDTIIPSTWRDDGIAFCSPAQ